MICFHFRNSTFFYGIDVVFLVLIWFHSLLAVFRQYNTRWKCSVLLMRISTITYCVIKALDVYVPRIACSSVANRTEPNDLKKCVTTFE